MQPKVITSKNSSSGSLLIINAFFYVIVLAVASITYFAYLHIGLILQDPNRLGAIALLYFIFIVILGGLYVSRTLILQKKNRQIVIDDKNIYFKIKVGNAMQDLVTISLNKLNSITENGSTRRIYTGRGILLSRQNYFLFSHHDGKDDTLAEFNWDDTALLSLLQYLKEKIPAITIRTRLLITNE